jgi:hypothetical protein
MRSTACFIFMLSLLCCTRESYQGIDDAEFIRITAGIAKAWNEGNAALAAGYFSADAVYEEPPKKQFYKGRKNIYEFFGGDKGFDKPMRMIWHNLAFNSAQQTGFGEYTFAMNNQYHGIVVMKFKEGKIVKWREYQYKSDLDWKTFAGEE